ncbi:uncharacterized protein (DUF305 family) [Deinococcus metalli]|uniref:Uncharacterized protein (DUF305 family) n=1 Tax=Deinococcus metalli TaxID=1141878 RepID=A0A7W8KHX0_9DEIO|nr:DUF305 domain-containing protein [Deinococcus metalli]MBB5378491.1 uncharacterized protein (DUF305 family) [Deinococcus metalli]GHF58098.1 hypothetical protein GCM10017781_37910 [Deinococcus metalli]
MKRALLTLALGTALLGTAHAGGADPSAMSGTAMMMRMSMEMHASMQPVMDDLRRLSGAAFDRAFYSMMIPHHQSAIDMSRAALPTLKDATVRAWAQAIINDQQKEIAEMQAKLRPLGGVDTARQTRMKQAMMGMMSMPVSDRTFLEMMIPHHGSAIDMGNLALQRGHGEGTVNMAQRIVTAQAKEIQEFQAWLRTHP